MRIDVISAVPALMESFFGHSIVKRSIEKKLLELNIIDLRAFGLNNYSQIDDYQYGGGAGMVLMPEPLFTCITEIQKKVLYDEIIYLTPDGEPYKQKLANRLSLKQNLLLIAGHYKGIDQRIRDHFVTMEISVGDYVLSGGELAAAILVDSIGRLIPGVLNDETSALEDSFQDGLLAPPVYTRPASFNGWEVPEVLLSGHEENIREWRLNQSIEKTRIRRPDILEEDLR
jgi:tRNA (guanine37-N1)-methyltransferase